MIRLRLWINVLKAFFTLVLALSLVFSESGTALAQQNLSLNDAVQVCLQNNFGIRIAKQDIQIATNNNDWGAAGRWPQVVLNFSDINRFQGIDNPASFINGDVRFTGLSGGLDLRWNIFQGFRTWISKDRFELLQGLTEGNLSIVVQNALQATILGYYDILLQDYQLALLDTIAENSRLNYERMKAKNKLGATTSFEVLQFEIAYATDKQNLLLQQRNLNQAKRNFSNTLGQRYDWAYNIADNLNSIAPREFVLNELLALLPRNNFDLRNQYINLEILQKDVKLAQSDRYPAINLNMGATHQQINFRLNNQDPRTGRTTEYFGNFSLQWNILNGGNISRQIKNAKIEERIGNLSAEQMKLQLETNLVEQYESYQYQKEFYRLSQQTHEMNRVNLSLAEQRLQNGSIDQFRFRIIQDDFLRSGFAQYLALFQLLTIETEILRLTGGLLTGYGY